jgi:hypothetical protein
MDFQAALYKQLYTLPEGTPVQARLATHIENSSGGITPPLVLAMEQKVRVEYGLGQVTPIDWSSLGSIKAKVSGPVGATTIDWASLLAFIEAMVPILEQILPLI